jgi:aminopeptidase N/puromycin-sensitive aminopeptidase
MNTRSFSAALRITLAIAALACLIFPFASRAAAQRLPSTVVPVHYALTLTPDLKAATFTGQESIDVMVKAATRTITLNAVEIDIQAVSATFGCFTSDQACSENLVLGSPAISLDKEKEQATFTFPNEIGPGKLVLNIHYTGILNDKLRGFYLSKTDRRSYAVTQFESTDARRAFPCFDEPAFKATFEISLTIDAADTAISNSPIASDTPGPGINKHTLEFATTPRMSTYLLAFLVGDFQCASGEQDGVALRVCSTPDKVALTSFAMGVAKFTLHYYDTYFGIHYPLKKLDLIGIPDFEAGAMENFGAITFRESILLIDPETAPLDAKKQVALDITHEMAHQWFGDLVTMQWWDNTWLNEGFATWMENKATAAMHPEWSIDETVASDENDTLDVDALPTTRAIRAQANTRDEIEQMFDSISYGKASDVLLMVENYLGEETFRKGVHAYLAAHEYGNATAEDFWNAQTATSHKPVDRIMESLVAQPGEPLLTFGAPDRGKVSVDQKRFFLSPSDMPDPAQKWTIPVCFKNGSGMQECQILTPETSSLKIPTTSLFFANANGKGYYRSAYAPRQYAAIVDEVETALTPAERISLTGDEWAQMRANKATVGDYLNLVAALKADPEAGVFANAVNAVSTIIEKVAASPEEKAALAAWIRHTFAPIYAKLGPPSPGDSANTRQLRAHLFGLLGYYGKDPAILAEAGQIAESYIADPASVDPTLGQTALAVAAENGNSALFDKLQHVFETSTDPELQESALRLLAQFLDPALVERSLDYALSGKVHNQDAAIQIAIALYIPETQDQAWKYLDSHWDKASTFLTPEMGADLVSSTGSFCSAEARDSVQSFFTVHKVPAADTYLKHALERIDGCIELRSLQEPNLKTWLAAQGAM